MKGLGPLVAIRAPPRFPGPRDSFAENGPAGAALGLIDKRPRGQAGFRIGTAEGPARLSGWSRLLMCLSAFGSPRYGFKTKELSTTSRARAGPAWLGPRARQCSSHDYSCSRGPKGPTRCLEHLSSPSPLPATGEHATLGGRSCSFWGPHILCARDCLWGLCGPSVDDLHSPAQPSGSPAMREATTSCPGSSSLGCVLPCHLGPPEAWARGHPASWTARGTHPALARVILQ